MQKHDCGREAHKNWIRVAPVLILLTSLGTGCGNYTYQKKKTAKDVTGDSISDLSDYFSTGSQSAGASAGGMAPVKVKIRGTGYSGSYSVEVPANRVLKVAFLPGKQDAQSSDGKFYNYSMLSVYVGVGQISQPTELLANGYGGGTARQSSVIDLSDAFTRTCSPDDSSCRQKVTITINQPQSDDVCFNQANTYCGGYYGHVPEGHPWNGTLIIQNDDTSAI
jgi:hypothetical protein